MPWRKHIATKGKFGNCYKITKGIVVRCDNRGIWAVSININKIRKRVPGGEGRDGLRKAILATEKLSAKMAGFRNSQDFGKKIKTRRETKLNISLIPTFKDYAWEWLEGNSKKWAYDTYKRYEVCLRLQILSNEIFDNKLNEIEKRDIKKVLRGIFKTHSAKTTKLCNIILNSIFNEAVEDFVEVRSNPVTGLLKGILPPLKKQTVRKSHPFTMEERDLFLDTAEANLPEGLVMVFKTMAYMGLRLGETLAINYNKIDFFNQTYHVGEQFKGKMFKTCTKNSEDRVVDMPEFLVEDYKTYITKLKQESLASGQGGEIGYLFLDPSENNRWPYSQRKVYYYCQKTCNSAGLEVRTNHDFRHTYASILLMKHMSIEYVKNQLGHSSIEITSSVYSHWIPGEGRGNLEAALTDSCRKMQKNAKGIQVSFCKKAKNP